MKREMTYGEALRAALWRAMERDPKVLVFGIGVDDHKAVFGTTAGFVERFGRARVFDTPISEGAMTGVAAGLARNGYRPVHVHIRSDFLYLALDQLLNMAAKWRAMFGGRTGLPMVVRAAVGRSWGQGAQHSQALHALCAHVPGIKVALPTSPADAYELTLAAIADPDPVVLFEHRLLYGLRGPVDEEAPPAPLRRTVVRRRGRDLTIAAWSYMAVEALQAAEHLARHGIEAEVVDPVTVAPLDAEPALESVRRTGRLLAVDASWTSCGASAELLAAVCERAHGALRAPARRLGMAATACPVSKPLEKAFYPDAASIAAAAFEMLGRRPPTGPAPELQTAFKGPF